VAFKIVQIAPIWFSKKKKKYEVPWLSWLSLCRPLLIHHHKTRVLHFLSSFQHFSLIPQATRSCSPSPVLIGYPFP
jgi:hypothetical protein